VAAAASASNTADGKDEKDGQESQEEQNDNGEEVDSFVLHTLKPFLAKTNTGTTPGTYVRDFTDFSKKAKWELATKTHADVLSELGNQHKDWNRKRKLISASAIMKAVACARGDEPVNRKRKASSAKAAPAPKRAR